MQTEGEHNQTAKHLHWQRQKEKHMLTGLHLRFYKGSAISVQRLKILFGV